MNTRFKLPKTWGVFGVALLIGTLAALAARSYLSTQIEAIEARSKSKTVQVIVASRELKRGDKISADNVAVRAIPVDYAHSSAIAPEAFDRVDGQPVAYPVKPGEMILWGLMESKRQPGFSARVEVGHRAMTVAVDEINSISGLLEPGDVIDLLVSLDQKGRKLTRPLLQGVQVMATGQRVVDSPREGERRQYSTVTIDITPAQAQQIILARDAGKVTALLRNPGDRDRIPGGNANMVALLANTVAATDNGIPVLYGSIKLTPENLAMGSNWAGRAAAAESDALPVPPLRAAASTPAASASTATAAAAAAASALPVRTVP